METYVRDSDLTLYPGDALEVLRSLPRGSVNCCITSPPYWGLRDYGTGTWDGGDPDCAHKVSESSSASSSTLDGGKKTVNHAQEGFREICPRCGARRVDQQLGLEPTPEQYVAAMVAVFREVRRVLADDGVMFLNLGDSYASDPGKGGSGTPNGRNNRGEEYARGKRIERGEGRWGGGNVSAPALKQKDLVGIPWAVAFALRADGWYLRSDIIWSKPNPMPESVTDRPTKSHEYVFLLSKNARYWFDQEAVREEAAWNYWGSQSSKKTSDDPRVRIPNYAANGRGALRNSGRNIRSVWEIATQPYAEAHFATYPEELVRRCLLAGCPAEVCGTCGKARERLTDVAYVKSPVHGSGSVVGRHYETGANNFDGAGMPRLNKQTTTTGWSDCGHDNYQPGTVLDPFAGSGTTALVARKHGRRSVLIELSADYCALAARRLQQLSLLAEPI